MAQDQQFTHSRQFARDAWLRALEQTAGLERGEGPTLPELVGVLAERYGPAPALIDESETVSFGELGRRVNGYARWAIEEGLGPGDTVCLFARNCADCLAIWLGILRAGASVALVNSSLSGAALAHAINAVHPRLVISGAAVAARVEAIRSDLPPSLSRWTHGGAYAELQQVDVFRGRYADLPLSPNEHPFPQLKMPALLVYTSGTTGLPKAAKVSQLKLMRWCRWFAGLLDVSPQDRLYDCLPLYHSVGGIAAAGALLVSGGSVVVRERFSASQFWKDVRENDCTLFCYVGELCRYLVNGPVQPEEFDHGLRACFGNGLAAGVWEKFRSRFRIPQILEFYASTEGSFSLFNCEGEAGSIGRIPPFLAQRNDIVLVKVDAETGAPLRGPDERCIACGPDEIGEAIGRLRNPGAEPGSTFEGYRDPDDGERKILRSAFDNGDAWFRSGDLMRRDARGFFYFVDRLGDTYRRKGENVSTQEVEAAIALCPGVAEVVAYGVRVPGAEGRAGMAAIVPGPEFDLKTLYRHLAKTLPSYARPVFIRICFAIDTTETFKPMKQKFAREGFDPTIVADPIYRADTRLGEFVALTCPSTSRQPCEETSA